MLLNKTHIEACFRKIKDSDPTEARNITVSLAISYGIAGAGDLERLYFVWEVARRWPEFQHLQDQQNDIAKRKQRLIESIQEGR